MRIILYNSLIPLFVELGEIAFYPHKLTVGASVVVQHVDEKGHLLTWCQVCEGV